MASPADAGHASLAPDSPELADLAADWFGTYVHIPFCTRVCPYCDFAVVEGKTSFVDRYVDAVAAEIGSASDGPGVDAVFIGGGTPSSVDPARIAHLIRVLGDRFELTDGAEVTIEANPEDWTTERSDRLRAGGVNRVSFGAQSLDPDVLGSLGRRHGPADIAAAVEEATTSGFGSISIDLIFGTPGETIGSWENSLRTAIGTPIDHVSTYALTVERGTPLSRAVAGGAPAPDEDDQADKYELAVEILPAAGFVQYETSNHAKPGHPCRYNLTAWAQGDYAAFGLGAHSHRSGTRAWNVRRLEEYVERIERGDSPRAGNERLDEHGREEERIIIGLRRRAGVRAGTLGKAWFESDDGRRLASARVVELVGDRLRMIKPLFTDMVGRSLVGRNRRVGIVGPR